LHLAVEIIGQAEWDPENPVGDKSGRGGRENGDALYREK